MEFFDRLRKALSSGTPRDKNSATEWGHVIAPSVRYPTAIEAIAALLPEAKSWQWATFEADRLDGEAAIIEVHGATINTCNEEVDLRAIARAIGLDALADAINVGGASGDDHSLHNVPRANVAEIAELVNAVYIHHYQLRTDYRIEGYLQD